MTAAKSLVSGKCQIDMLAGPSEVLVIADKSCIPATVASDLLAQAEHDTEARPILVCTEKSIAEEVNAELRTQLAALPTRDVAREAVKKGYACVCPDIKTAVRISDEIGPEHLEIITENAEQVGDVPELWRVFIGNVSAEVWATTVQAPTTCCPRAAPPHGRALRLHVRIRTWMNISDGDSQVCQDMINDCIALGRIEGLEGHARAAEQRLTKSKKARLS